MELDRPLITKAVSAILRYEEKKSEAKSKSSLFEDYAKAIIVQVQLKESISHNVARPVRVQIPHSLFAGEEDNSSICIFCKTSDKDTFEKLISEKKIPGLARIISIGQVRKEFKSFKDRKTLLSEHSHFLCDANVMGQLYNDLGKVFSARNKYPVPIKFKDISKVPSGVMHALNSTYMHLKGQNISIKMGHTNMTAQEIADNICSGLQFAVQKLPDNWRSVHSVHVKSGDSASLPVYSKTKSDYLAFAKDLVSSGADVKLSAVTPKAAKGKKKSTDPAVDLAVVGKALPAAKLESTVVPVTVKPAAKAVVSKAAVVVESVDKKAAAVAGKKRKVADVSAAVEQPAAQPVAAAESKGKGRAGAAKAAKVDIVEQPAVVEAKPVTPVSKAKETVAAKPAVAAAAAATTTTAAKKKSAVKSAPVSTEAPSNKIPSPGIAARTRGRKPTK